MSNSTVKRFFSLFDEEESIPKKQKVKSSTNKCREKTLKKSVNKAKSKVTVNEAQNRNINFLKRLRTFKVDQKLSEKLKLQIINSGRHGIVEKDEESVFTNEDFKKFMCEYKAD